MAGGRVRRTRGRGPVPDRGRSSARLLASALAVALVLIALATLGIDLIEGTGGPSGSTPRATASPVVSPGGSSGAALSPTLRAASTAPASQSLAAPASPSATAPASPSGSPPYSATGSPSAGSSGTAPIAGAAPSSARGFRPQATVIAMGFPFRAGTPFTYGAGFRRPRDGVVYPYNLIRGVAPDGTLLRAHDGQDLLVPLGTLVLAPFAGVVVDPRETWRPWDPARYGKVVVIRSTEPTSPGYSVVLAHLSRQSVAIGATVRRGQVVGRTGRTGNAAEGAPHLHIEIRAPFAIRYGYGGVIRWLDPFDIGPSLRAADPSGA